MCLLLDKELLHLLAKLQHRHRHHRYRYNPILDHQHHRRHLSAVHQTDLL
jgi:hypothetical protein